MILMNSYCNIPLVNEDHECSIQVWGGGVKSKDSASDLRKVAVVQKRKNEKLPFTKLQFRFFDFLYFSRLTTQIKLVYSISLLDCLLLVDTVD
jgi:hypothetical protein